jgi:hypothetical protein
VILTINGGSAMKRIATIISVVAGVMMFSALSIRADEGTVGGGYGERMETPQKNECLLVAKNCANDVDSIQERIDRLNGEIAKGRDVYTDGELRTLKNELDEANKFLDFIMTNSGA